MGEAPRATQRIMAKGLPTRLLNLLLLLEVEVGRARGAYPRTVAALRSLRGALQVELTRKSLCGASLATRTSRLRMQMSRLRKRVRELEESDRRHKAAKIVDGLIELEWIVRVFLASPHASARAVAQSFRAVAGMDECTVSRPTISKIKDSWTEMYMDLAYNSARSAVEHHFATAQLKIVFIVHVQDEAAMRLRSGDARDGPTVPRRGRASKVQAHLVTLVVGRTRRDIPTELEALGDKTAPTLATSMETLLRRVVSFVLGGSAHKIGARGIGHSAHVLGARAVHASAHRKGARCSKSDPSAHAVGARAAHASAHRKGARCSESDPSAHAFGAREVHASAHRMGARCSESASVSREELPLTFGCGALGSAHVVDAPLRHGECAWQEGPLVRGGGALGSAHVSEAQGVQSERWLVHIIVGDGIPTNLAAAKLLWACVAQVQLGTQVRYFIVVVKCGTHQAALSAKSGVVGSFAAAAGGDLYKTVAGTAVRLFKYIINDYYEEMVNNVRAWVSRQLRVLGPREGTGAAPSGFRELYTSHVIPDEMMLLWNNGLEGMLHQVGIGVDPKEERAELVVRFSRFIILHLLQVAAEA